MREDNRELSFPFTGLHFGLGFVLSSSLLEARIMSFLTDFLKGLEEFEENGGSQVGPGSTDDSDSEDEGVLVKRKHPFSRKYVPSHTSVSWGCQRRVTPVVFVRRRPLVTMPTLLSLGRYPVRVRKGQPSGISAWVASSLLRQSTLAL